MNWTKDMPTVPGDYKWRLNDTQKGIAITLVFDEEAAGEILVRLGDWGALPLPKDGEWCRLVPADEIEKAWDEGWTASSNYHYADDAFTRSRAKRVMEGRE